MLEFERFHYSGLVTSGMAVNEEFAISQCSSWQLPWREGMASLALIPVSLRGSPVEPLLLG